MKYLVMSVLTDESRKKLLNIASKVPIRLLDYLYCHHVTLAYGIEDVSAYIEGDISVWKADKIIWDSKCECLPLTLVGGDPYCEKKFPHVTISTDVETKPQYSAELIESEHHTGYRFDAVELTGCVKIIELEE